MADSLYEDPAIMEILQKLDRIGGEMLVMKAAIAALLAQSEVTPETLDGLVQEAAHRDRGSADVGLGQAAAVFFSDFLKRRA